MWCHILSSAKLAPPTPLTLGPPHPAVTWTRAYFIISKVSTGLESEKPLFFRSVRPPACPLLSPPLPPPNPRDRRQLQDRRRSGFNSSPRRAPRTRPRCLSRGEQRLSSSSSSSSTAAVVCLIWADSSLPQWSRLGNFGFNNPIQSGLGTPPLCSFNRRHIRWFVS